MAKPNPTLLRRQREQKRNQKKMDKARRKAERAEEKSSAKDRDQDLYEDPDIAGIVPGPQPKADDFGENDTSSAGEDQTVLEDNE